MRPFTCDNMGDEIRDQVLLNLKEGLDPEVVDDWGDYDRDYSHEQHEVADGMAGADRIQTFYESTIGGLFNLK